ncbi:hypothetical protein LZ31DRAFT_549663 [Colletotrichum somersetense]|nr:hypothetical protein LZ31DRAFT_549663 [Colletotrichum somersetense]
MLNLCSSFILSSLTLITDVFEFILFIPTSLTLLVLIFILSLSTILDQDSRPRLYFAITYYRPFHFAFFSWPYFVHESLEWVFTGQVYPHTKRENEKIRKKERKLRVAATY